MVSASGLPFPIEDHTTTKEVNARVEYHLVARDAFNEITLWKMPMKKWSNLQTDSIKSIPTQQQRLPAARKHPPVVPGTGEPMQGSAFHHHGSAHDHMMPGEGAHKGVRTRLRGSHEVEDLLLAIVHKF